MIWWDWERGQPIVGPEPVVRMSDVQSRKYLRLWRREKTRTFRWRQNALNKPSPLLENNLQWVDCKTTVTQQGTTWQMWLRGSDNQNKVCLRVGLHRLSLKSRISGEYSNSVEECSDGTAEVATGTTQATWSQGQPEW